MATLLNDWIFWLSSIPRDELVWLIVPLIIFDGARYCMTSVCVWMYDTASGLFGFLTRKLTGREQEQEYYTFCPSVSIVIAGLNEGDSLYGTLSRVWGSYPKLEIIVVDDGSTDNMSDEARRFTRNHDGVTVITRERGGKSSALNAGVAYARSEVIVILDADSELAPHAIWEIVAPLADPDVAAVSGNVRVRNGDACLITRLQSYEYLRSIFLGRIVSSRLGILGIVSGAFGAFRTSLLRQMGGWDVGPGEDEDLVLRIRKLGYRVEFAPYADCLTDAPESWKVLTKQRRRWEWAVITFASRKHIDMANPRNRHFRFLNMAMFIERWVFNLLLPLWFWVYLVWVVANGYVLSLGNLTVLFYLCYLLGDFIQFLIILSYSATPLRDAKTITAIPLMPLYQMYQRFITSYAILEEAFSRRSFKDNFVPKHVREATWHW